MSQFSTPSHISTLLLVRRLASVRQYGSASNKAKAAGFQAFVTREGDRLDRALAIGWSRSLVEVASRFFAKAFVSEGLEQLLWHINGHRVTHRAARARRGLAGTKA
jgi:hypothetical protein